MLTGGSDGSVVMAEEAVSHGGRVVVVGWWGVKRMKEGDKETSRGLKSVTGKFFV